MESIPLLQLAARRTLTARSARSAHAGSEVFQAIVIQDIGDRVSYSAHDVLQRAVSFVGIGTVDTLLIGGLAHAPDRRQRAIENPDDVPQRDFRWGLDEGITSLNAADARQQAGMLEAQKNVL